MLADKIRDFALARGADLVGFAAAADFGDAPSGFGPQDIMPQAKRVVVLARALPRGAVTSGNQAVYTAHHLSNVKHLDELARAVAVFIEEQGITAMPVPADDPYFHWEEDRKHGMGIFSHRHAAVKAGLGVIGKNALLITPQYGNRVELVSILTDMLFPPPAPAAGPCPPTLASALTGGRPAVARLCPPACRLCLDACPVGALAGDCTVEQLKCRSNLSVKSPRGHSLVKCWQCRAVCPARV
jgi:epoxyqueuosine reductase QueG